MAKMPSIEVMMEKVANIALDEYTYNGKTLRQWAALIAKGEAVEVVRCKYCKWRDEDNDCTHEWWRDTKGFCVFVEDDMFCSCGERKGDDGKPL